MPNTQLRMPGATLITRLKVYDTPGPDGQRGGTPHFHLACSELYFVLSGSGAVELIDINGFERVELQPHAAFLFSPGTLHRLIAPESGELHLLITMQNSGLPERGDTVATFNSKILCDDLAYHKAMRAVSLDDAYRRRDQAVEGFIELRETFERSREEGRAALETLFRQALSRTGANHKNWYECVASGAFFEAQDSLQRILELSGKKFDRLLEPEHYLIPSSPASTVGFCGHLNRYFDRATFLPDGVTL